MMQKDDAKDDGMSNDDAAVKVESLKHWKIS